MQFFLSCFSFLNCSFDYNTQLQCAVCKRCVIALPMQLYLLPHSTVFLHRHMNEFHTTFSLRTLYTAIIISVTTSSLAYIFHDLLPLYCQWTNANYCLLCLVSSIRANRIARISALKTAIWSGNVNPCLIHTGDRQIASVGGKDYYIVREKLLFCLWKLPSSTRPVFISFSSSMFLCTLRPKILTW